MISQSELDAIRSRAEAASGDRWETHHREAAIQTIQKPDGSRRVICLMAQCVATGKPLHSAEDAQFIAHARTDVPALLGEVARLREIEKAAQEVCDLHRGVRCAALGYLDQLTTYPEDTP